MITQLPEELATLQQGRVELEQLQAICKEQGLTIAQLREKLKQLGRLARAGLDGRVVAGSSLSSSGDLFGHSD